ncbi:hypothetical protein As57867_022567, partial [Aphanomyces stellatus]
PKGAYPDSSTVHVTNPASESWGTWKVFNVGNGKIALRGDAGNYLARCNGCAPGAAYPDQAFVHVSDWHDKGWAQWTCYDAGNGKIALQADTGKYLARCNNCIPGAAYVDQTFVHATDWHGTPWAQWKVVDLTPHNAPSPPKPYPVPVPQPVPQPVPAPYPAPVPQPVPVPPPYPVIPSAACTFVDGDVLSLQADSGKYLDRCNNCVPKGAYPDSSTVHVTNPASESWGTWKVFNVGNGKIALRGDAGNYLARCNGCAPGAAYPDQAFVHVSDWHDKGWAQWTCYDAGNGKIALQADTGKYLARCN